MFFLDFIEEDPVLAPPPEENPPRGLDHSQSLRRNAIELDRRDLRAEHEYLRNVTSQGGLTRNADRNGDR